MGRAATHEQTVGDGQRRPERLQMGNLWLDRLPLEGVVERASASIRERRPCHIVTANLQFVSRASRDPAFVRMVNEADVVVADGMPLVWLSRVLRSPVPRITGHDLLHLFCTTAATSGQSVFFLGAAPGVAESASRRLNELYPGLRVAGIRGGRFTEDGCAATDEEERAVVAAIREARPDYLFVALGCPKQEAWIRRHIDSVDVPVCVGIGGVLDVMAGRLNRAPAWMQRLSLEWLYRLRQEPGRLAKRYLVEDLPTAARITVAALLRSAKRHRGR